MQETHQDRSPGESDRKFLKARGSTAEDGPADRMGMSRDELPLPTAPPGGRLLRTLSP